MKLIYRCDPVAHNIFQLVTGTLFIKLICPVCFKGEGKKYTERIRGYACVQCLVYCHISCLDTPALVCLVCKKGNL